MAKKTYLDYFLDNELEKDKKKKVKKKTSKYKFGQTQEDAILLYNSGVLNEIETEKLWGTIIYPGFMEIITGVLQMRMFHYMPHNVERADLLDDTMFRLSDKMYRFTPGMIGKSGKPVKAFSYFSTIAKHYILEKYVKGKRIIDHKADVESSIDLQILSAENLQRIATDTVTNADFSINENFNQQIRSIVSTLEKEVYTQEDLTSDYVKVGLSLIHAFKNWHKLDFNNRNDFVRIIILHSGLKQVTVSPLFKKYKDLLLGKNTVALTNAFQNIKKNHNSSPINKDDEFSKVHTFEDFENYTIVQEYKENYLKAELIDENVVENEQ